MAKKKMSYSEALAEIETIVDQIENGNPDVDKLSEMVKRAAKLVKNCQESLRTTNEEIDNTLSDLSNN